MIRIQRRMLIFGILLAFFAGAIFGLFISGANVHAAQDRPPKNLSAAQKKFLEGGSRDYTVLKEILKELQENQRQTARLETVINGMNKNIQTIPAKLDSTNKLLTQIRDDARKR